MITSGYRGMTPSKTLAKLIIIPRPLASEELLIVSGRHIIRTAAIARFPTLDLKRERLNQLRQFLLRRFLLVDW
jgi:hypothetical protein